MTQEMLFVFGVLAATIALFLSDRLRLDLIAVMSMLVLLLSGVLTPQEALAGFADPLVLIIAGLFVVGGGLFNTGVARTMGRWLSRIAGTNESRLIVTTMLVVAFLSAFMSSTGATAVLLPVVVSVAWNAQISPSRLLIPLAFGSLIGGMLTLIGTPPNIVVSDQLAAQGFRPFGFFDFTPIGLLVLGVGSLFMIFAGRQLLPERVAGARAYSAARGDTLSMSDLARSYGVQGNQYYVRVRRNSPLIGRSLAETGLRSKYGVTVLEIQHWDRMRRTHGLARQVELNTVFAADDLLHIQGSAEAVARMASELELGIQDPSGDGRPFVSRELGLAEVLLTPRSHLEGQTLEEARFHERYGLIVLGIKRMGQPLPDDPATVQLRFGDTLLVAGRWQQIDLLHDERHAFVVVGQPEEMIAGLQATSKAPIAVAIMIGMLLLLTFEVLPTVATVLVAAVAMVLTGCLNMEEVYETINWESVVLIAGMLPMATALQKTGGVELIAGLITAGLGSAGGLAVMAGLFVLTSLFSQFISNTATTVLIAPIALQAALTMGLQPHAFLMTVAIAASTAFATPIASPVNTLVLNPGGYRFGDFARVGVPLQLLVLVITILLVPLLFPFSF